MNKGNIKIFFDYQIACFQKYGGVSRYHYELLKELSKLDGCKCDMLAVLSRNYYLQKYFNKRALQDYKVPLRCISRFNKLITKIWLVVHKYDVIHPTWYEDYFSKKLNAKKVITIHDMTQEICMKNQQLTIELKKKYIYNSDHIIAVSQNTKNDILKLYPDISSDKISVVYHGVNKLPDAVAPTNWSCPKRYILYVGSRSDYKNGMLIIQALSNLIKKNNLKIIYAGGNAFTEEETNIIKQNEMDNYVIQKNVSDAELAYLYQNAICFVYPSSYEGFGFPILEAFDNSCPVVCSNSSCFPEIARDAALYFDLKNTDMLVKAVNDILNQSKVRDELVEKGLERVKDFSWKKTAEQVLKIYQNVVASN